MPSPTKRFRRRVVGAAILAGIAAAGIGGAVLGRAEPSHDRAWNEEQAMLPSVTFEDSVVHVRGVRNFIYRSANDFTPGYDDRSYDLRRLERVWYVLSPFGARWRGPAHSFLSFGFSDGQYVSVSVEARREMGEAYSPLKGLFRRYELMYVIGDERDLIGLRAVTWDDPVYLYPMRATPEQARALFTDMMNRAAALRERPEFYNTFSNNCTTNILDPVNRIAEKRIPYGLDVLLPGYSDRLAHRLGLIDTELPLKEARERFLVNARARAAADDPDFSLRIRGG
jgi:hypothetical protein